MTREQFAALPADRAAAVLWKALEPHYDRTGIVGLMVQRARELGATAPLRRASMDSRPILATVTTDEGAALLIFLVDEVRGDRAAVIEELDALRNQAVTATIDAILEELDALGSCQREKPSPT